MSGTATAEALVALHAAEAELEAALAAEKGTDGAPAAVVLTPEQIAAELAATQAYRDAGSPPPTPLRTDGPTLDEYVKAGYLAESYPPAGYTARVAPAELPKWLVLPGYLGPIAINGT